MEALLAGFAKLIIRFALLTLVVYREARGEPLDAKIVVAQVVENRINDPRWPDDIEDVILMKHQFSSFDPGDPNAIKFPSLTDGSIDELALVDCLRAVFMVVAHKDDLARGANHYHDQSVDLAKVAKAWLGKDATVADLLSKKVGSAGDFSYYKL